MDKLYSINEVAIKLNLSDKTLRRWEEAGRFRGSRTLGNQRRYSLEDLQILDAIKHGTIPDQKDLLTVEQAAKFCGVSTTTLARWENAGKIHPFITSGNTYYPRHKLTEKLEELKQALPIESAPMTTLPPAPQPTTLAPTPTPTPTPRLTPLSKHSLGPVSPTMTPYIINACLTLLLILSYHFLMNKPEQKPLSPQATTPSGVVQGATTTEDPRLDLLEKKFLDHLESDMLKNAAPSPVTTINLSNKTLLSGTGSLGKGKDQVTITNSSIRPNSVVTASFTADYAPAKKYWVSLALGSFTLHTDFPVSADTPFNYLVLESETATVAAETR